jgi:hypothetical protein
MNRNKFRELWFSAIFPIKIFYLVDLPQVGGGEVANAPP